MGLFRANEMIIPNKYKVDKIPNWQQADQLVICKVQPLGVELGTTKNKSTN